MGILVTKLARRKGSDLTLELSFLLSLVVVLVEVVEKVEKLDLGGLEEQIGITRFEREWGKRESKMGLQWEVAIGLQL